MSTATSVEPLVVRTVELPADAGAGQDLVRLLPAQAPLAWLRRGDGLVGWGAAARLVVSGPDRFARALRWWHCLHAEAAVRDEVGLPGTGPVVFGSFAFADSPTPSVLVLPRVLVGRRDGRRWLTTIGSASEPDPLAGTPSPPRRPRDLRYADGALSVDQWREAVAGAVRRIRAGQLSKVVLARDLLASAGTAVDARHLLAGLAGRYPDCFTFSVDGLVGATPELLVRRDGPAVTSRVLAGTAWRGWADADAEVEARLVASAKDREEHAYATASAAEALEPFCTDLSVATAPGVLRLPNLVHLATEVSGRLRFGADTGLSGTGGPGNSGSDTGDAENGGASALRLAGALHPTAAVCGTPTAAAAALIRSVEGMDRGRYAGPVGWTDARGDGEWGIALRCAQVDGRQVRMFAGCGIVAGSDPDVELAEAQAKFVAVRDALES